MEKSYSIIILLAVVIGLVFGRFEAVKLNAEVLIVPLLITMLYITSLQIPVKELERSFRNKRFTYITLVMNFIWTPLLAWLLASVFLADHPALWIGFIMLMVTPCTDWYLIFTGITKGDVSLSTSILPLNLILQILLLPFYLVLFTETQGFVSMASLVESVILVLFVPLVLAFITKFLLKKSVKWEEKIKEPLTFLPIILLSIAIVAMFASTGHLLLDNLEVVWLIMIPILLFFIINFAIGQKVGSALNFTYKERVSLSFTTLARNSPIALAIALTAFPDQPLVALSLVVGPLFELPLLALVSQMLLWRKKSN